MEDKRIVEMEDEHGKIYLVIPNRKPTKEEWDELYKGIAKAIIMDEKYKAQQKKEAT